MDKWYNNSDFLEGANYSLLIVNVILWAGILIKYLIK
jgi:hypothetical protein